MLLFLDSVFFYLSEPPNTDFTPACSTKTSLVNMSQYLSANSVFSVQHVTFQESMLGIESCVCKLNNFRNSLQIAAQTVNISVDAHQSYVKPLCLRLALPEICNHPSSRISYIEVSFSRNVPSFPINYFFYKFILTPCSKKTVCP